MNDDFVTRAEFSRLCQVSRKTVSLWAREGRITMVGEKVDVADSRRRLALHRRGGAPESLRASPPLAQQPTSLSIAEALKHLAALDWKPRAHDWGHEAMDARVKQAAEAVGYVAVTSEALDDGHFGGYQLREPELVARYGGPVAESIAAGFGFELDAWAALAECRRRLDNPEDGPLDLSDALDVRLDLLHAIAFPLAECQVMPASKPGQRRPTART
jgi:hypothetical protein